MRVKRPSVKNVSKPQLFSRNRADLVRDIRHAELNEIVDDVLDEAADAYLAALSFASAGYDREALRAALSLAYKRWTQR